MNWSKFLYVIFGDNSIQDGVHMPLFSVQNEPKIHYSEMFSNKQKNDMEQKYRLEQEKILESMNQMKEHLETKA